MSEIEVKRKELEDELIQIKEALNIYENAPKEYTWKQFLEYKLKVHEYYNNRYGFNLACEMKDKECKEKLEMARKEFINKLSRLKKCSICAYGDYDGSMKYDANEDENGSYIHEDEIDKLKQSLEEIK